MYNPDMTKVEAILEQTNGLTPPERKELLRMLAAQTFGHSADGEAAVGQRGLAAWAESTRGEDWSMYYPDSLGNGGRSRLETTQ